MFDHLGFYTACELRERRAFYTAVLGELGYRMLEDHTQGDGSGWLVFGSGLPRSAFFVVAKGRPERWSALQQPGLSPIHIAFCAPSKQSVDRFHATGLREGAINNGDPGVRRAPYYCCFLLDADGNNIEAGVYLGD
jgi:catechol 2,3-dioxygenase-like lactoylglutathione lyase family enzyme